MSECSSSTTHSNLTTNCAPIDKTLAITSCRLHWVNGVCKNAHYSHVNTPTLASTTVLKISDFSVIFQCINHLSDVIRVLSKALFPTVTHACLANNVLSCSNTKRHHFTEAFSPYDFSALLFCKSLTRILSRKAICIRVFSVGAHAIGLLLWHVCGRSFRSVFMYYIRDCLSVPRTSPHPHMIVYSAQARNLFTPQCDYTVNTHTQKQLFFRAKHRVLHCTTGATVIHMWNRIHLNALFPLLHCHESLFMDIIVK